MRPFDLQSRPGRGVNNRLSIARSGAAGEDVLLGHAIPYLPDTGLSPSLNGASQRERIGELLARQASLIVSLAAFGGTAFSLRYVLDPVQHAIRIALLARATVRPGSGEAAAIELASSLEAGLSTLDIPVEAISSSETLLRTIDPIPDAFIVEIRQHEEVAQLRLGDAYVVHPFRAAATTWLAAFEVLARQRHPCLISVHLEPTFLSSGEQATLSEAASLAESLVDFRYAGLTGEQRVPDPQARIVSRLYAEALHRLTRPFLLVVQVASPDPTTAVGLAQVFAAEMCDRVTPSQSAQSAERLPSSFDIVQPRSRADLASARRTLTDLHLTSWGEQMATAGKERLRYLADAETASAAFRFPIALQEGIPGVRVRQSAPSFDVGPRTEVHDATQIPIGSFLDGPGTAAVPLDALTRHVLIAGTNGSGKTTTCFQLLSELWARGIPFLVIEPAKTEYRALLRGPFGQDVQVFTLGDETTSPFRLNPLEILPGTRVESHVAAVRMSLEASFPTIGPLPSLLEEALHNVYLQKGWELTARARTNDEREMPTLTDLYFEIVRVTDRRGYAGEVLQNIRAAVAGRVATLLRGSKGRMLDTRRSLSFDELLARPTVLELESLNDDEKALVMLFLLTALREHCRAVRQDSRLQHVTLIEEAHRVMRQVQHAGNREVSGDAAAVASGMASDLLSEVRAYGEGIIIAEQIPGRLAEDALKNTNTKIVHRLPGEDDRRAVAATIAALPEQEQFMGKTNPGVAALSAPGYEHPTFVQVPDFRSRHALPTHLPDSAVEAAAQATARNIAHRPFQGCEMCRKVCQYRDRVASIAYEVERVRRVNLAMAEFMSKAHAEPDAAWNGLVETCRAAVGLVGLEDDSDAAYCYFTHVSSRPISAASAERFRAAAKEAV